jgi:hypothetical protein
MMNRPFSISSRKRSSWMNLKNKGRSEIHSLRKSVNCQNQNQSLTWVMSFTEPSARQLPTNHLQRSQNKSSVTFTRGDSTPYSTWSTNCFAGGHTTTWHLSISREWAMKRLSYMGNSNTT